MGFNTVGKDCERWDARAKVTGKADYTADIPVKNMLHAKICRAKIAHGIVKSYDISEAMKVTGVVKILTADDVPQNKFPTAGHPYSLDPAHSDVSDRNILTKRVRLYGDEIAAVIAEDELAAEKAANLIRVEYEEFPFYLTPEESLAPGAVEIQEGTGNIVADTVAELGDVEAAFRLSDFIVEGDYKTQTVQHCHMENQVAYAYQDVDGRWVCVSSTQIPHICRRILGQAFGMPWGRFRVIKPFIGGGFGNKQDVTIEPLVVALSMAVAGRPVMLSLTREESLAFTRVRHAISYKMKMGATKDGRINAMYVEAVSTNGAYTSHGHSIAVKGAGIIQTLYNVPNMTYRSKTVLTNTAAAGAMRGYGVPQIIFALESLVDKMVREMNADPIKFRTDNFLPEGAKHPLNQLTMHTNRVSECLAKGVEKFEYYKKLEAAKSRKSGDVRRGVGVAAFSYATGVYPYSLEIAGCRLSLNQDGTVKMLVGATEIGQGSDTVFRQIAAEAIGISCDHIYADAFTDTDYSPFDSGAYASRQTYVTGMAVKKAAMELKQKILHAANRFFDIDESLLDIVDGNIVYKAGGKLVEPLSELALKTYYEIPRGGCITAEVSNNFHANSFPMGVSLAEVDVDIKTGQVEILSLMNVHDSGVIINPKLAEGQVEGGMGMGISYCLSEELRYDSKTGKPLNNNLLDYKMPTFMDVIDMECEFVEPYDATGPYGNKGLGEPPIISPPPAIRNAVVDAIGVEVNAMPLSPQKIFEVLTLNETSKETSQTKAEGGGSDV